MTAHDLDRSRAPRLTRFLKAKLAFGIAGTLSFLFSVFLWFISDEPQQAIFVGLWVPSIFGLGALILSGETRR